MSVRSGTIAANSVWDQTSVVYAVEGDVLVATGVTLTMSSGLVVKFRGDGPGSNGYGVVGNQRNLFVDGTLIADGTPENPIYFTSLRDDIVGGDTNNDSANTVPVAGNWGRIEFRNTSSASLLDNVVIRYAGATDYNSTAVTTGQSTMAPSFFKMHHRPSRTAPCRGMPSGASIVPRALRRERRARRF